MNLLPKTTTPRAVTGYRAAIRRKGEELAMTRYTIDWITYVVNARIDAPPKKAILNAATDDAA